MFQLHQRKFTANSDDIGLASELLTPFKFQLAWARSYAVGCGAFRCEELAGAEDANENALYLVCYYGPGYDINQGW